MARPHRVVGTGHKTENNDTVLCLVCQWFPSLPLHPPSSLVHSLHGHCTFPNCFSRPQVSDCLSLSCRLLSSSACGANGAAAGLCWACEGDGLISFGALLFVMPAAGALILSLTLPRIVRARHFVFSTRLAFPSTRGRSLVVDRRTISSTPTTLRGNMSVICFFRSAASS